MRTRVKICCIASPQEAALAVRYGADLLGLVAEMPSGPGPIPDSNIRDIANIVSPGATPVLLTSRDMPDSIARHVEYCQVPVVQIVRHIDPGMLEILRRNMPGTKIMQVVHVSDESTIEIARDYGRFADAILLDSGKPAAEDAPEELGGTGRTHDWTISRKIVDTCGRPVFLAGGLTPDNVSSALQAVRPYGVDLCSGVRTDGQLDEKKLAAFMRAVNAFDRQENG